ncbi:MAG: hypothetical protein KUG71_02035 [Porticoccaceae bacterium]|nr:hypothetical protein [Porticoccaceae bacterium]
MTRRMVGCLLAVFLAGPVLGLVLEGKLNRGLADNFDASLDDRTRAQVTQFADATFECGVYYQYTAGGMKKNPGVPSEMIAFVSRNSASLLQTADQLYHSAGVSTQAKYQELMARAKVMLREQENNPDTDSDIIFEFGEKCRLLLISYPAKLRKISELLESN